ncbi:MAG: O-antigen ligase family protein, partial [Dehalococcoidia bacterium]
MTTHQPTTHRAPLGPARVLRLALVLLSLSFLAVIFGAGLAQFHEDPSFVLTVAFLCAVAPFIWRFPQLGLYLLAGGAAAIETFRLRFPDSVTDVIPFFRSLDSLGSPFPAPASPGEILAVGTIAVVVLKRLSAGHAPLEKSPLFPPLAALLVLTAIGVARGLAAGGDLSTAIFEARAALYLSVAVLLAYNLVHTERHVRVLLWVLLGTIAVKSFLGMWRYLVTLDGDLSLAGSLSPNTNALFAHEESVFFAFFLMFLFAAFLFRAGKAQRLFALAFSFPVLLALLANERRAGIVILAAGLLVIAFAVFALEPSRRRFLVRAAMAALLIAPVYFAAFAGNDGILGQPARAVVSLFTPDQRDESSNEYRVIEYENVRLTIMESPVLGAGYGVPFTMYEPLPDISESYTFWDTVPHNTLMWVWLRLGIVGLIVFWFFVGRSIIASALSAKTTTSPYLRSIAVLAIAATVGWLLMGAVDVGLANVRLAILTGVLLGVAARVPLIEAGKAEAAER